MSYKMDQYEDLTVTVDCPHCHESFEVDVEIGINKPDAEVEVINIEEKL